jgi:hypothetical protein
MLCFVIVLGLVAAVITIATADWFWGKLKEFFSDPFGEEDVDEALAELMEKAEIRARVRDQTVDLIVEVLVDTLKFGRTEDRLRAAEILLERGYGKPPEVKLGGES